MEYNLAQINIAKMVGPIDSPAMKDFVDNLDRVNALAEGSPGFVWRLKDESNSATNIKVFDDPLVIVNMSVWSSIDALMQYVYKSDHVEVFKRRKEWFEKMDKAYMTLWYTPANTFPTIAQGIERLEYLDKYGDTPYSFTFRKRFTAAEATAYALQNQ